MEHLLQCRMYNLSARWSAYIGPTDNVLYKVGSLHGKWSGVTMLPHPSRAAKYRAKWGWRVQRKKQHKHGYVKPSRRFDGVLDTLRKYQQGMEGDCVRGTYLPSIRAVLPRASKSATSPCDNVVPEGCCDRVNAVQVCHARDSNYRGTS